MTSKFLKDFNTETYNTEQIGNNKQTLSKLYNAFVEMKIPKNYIEQILLELSFYSKNNLNITLLIEIISKSLGYIEKYDIEDIVQTCKQIHDIYYRTTTKMSLEKYLSDSEDERVSKLFSNHCAKDINLGYNVEPPHMADLKFAAAIELNQSEYQELVSYLENYNENNNAPLNNFQLYQKVRNSLKSQCKLFWDILFAYEFIITLTKNNISLKSLYPNNVLDTQQMQSIEDIKIVQLDLFSYKEAEERPVITSDILQLSTIYNSNFTTYKTETDLLSFYLTLSNMEQSLYLPKLKQTKTNYLYNFK